MKRLLIIDDEKLYQKMVAHAVQSLGFEIETADHGEAGVAAALRNPPDLIICDVMMPGLNGYQVVQRLRRDPRFAQIPIMILTAQAELGDKLAAFEAGADDHMTKPFEPAELVARLNVLLRRSENIRALQSQVKPAVEAKARVIAVHSLRGGVGCSSIAVNLGVAFALKHHPTLLIDQVIIAGQVALMLNGSLKRTWANIAQIKPGELDWEILQSIIGHHDCGVHWIAAPTYPSEAELVTAELFSEAFQMLRAHFDYIVVDLPHDFDATTIEVLDAADQIVMPLAPELASVRAAAAAMDTYGKLGYPPEKIKLVMNYTFEQKGLARKKIEAVLQHAMALVLPYAPDLFIEAINAGQPIVLAKPKERMSEAFHYLAENLG